MGTSPLQRRLARVIRKHREAVGLSQEKLAEEAGIHRTYVSMIERGIGNPTLIVLADLAEALDTTLSILAREIEARD